MFYATLFYSLAHPFECWWWWCVCHFRFRRFFSHLIHFSVHFIGAASGHPLCPISMIQTALIAVKASSFAVVVVSLSVSVYTCSVQTHSGTTVALFILFFPAERSVWIRLSSCFGADSLDARLQFFLLFFFVCSLATLIRLLLHITIANFSLSCTCDVSRRISFHSIWVCVNFALWMSIHREKRIENKTGNSKSMKYHSRHIKESKHRQPLDGIINFYGCY